MTPGGVGGQFGRPVQLSDRRLSPALRTALAMPKTLFLAAAVFSDSTRSLFLAPADANELVWLMANRIAQRRVPSSGELVFSPLPPGTYVVGSEGEGELGRVRVEGEAAEIELD